MAFLFWDWLLCNRMLLLEQYEMAMALLRCRLPPEAGGLEEEGRRPRLKGPSGMGPRPEGIGGRTIAAFLLGEPR